jgi:hypothetical protein
VVTAAEELRLDRARVDDDVGVVGQHVAKLYHVVVGVGDGLVVLHEVGTFLSAADRVVVLATTASTLVPPTGGLTVTVRDEVEATLPVL